MGRRREDGSIEDYGWVVVHERPRTPPVDSETAAELAAASGVADEAPCALQTPDPRFDPRQPVTINGYRFNPATEA